MKKVLIVFGTRPEAIKMAPLVKRLSESNHFVVKICSTGQHQDILDEVLKIFDIHLDYELNVFEHQQSLGKLGSRIMHRLAGLFEVESFDLVLVHGDTQTTVMAALAAFQAKIPVAHVEAGLRSGSRMNPWPEEVNRRLTTQLSEIHFAPTIENKNFLISDGVESNNIFVTGNTVIDALKETLRVNQSDSEFKRIFDKKYPVFGETAPLVLVTMHRRENHGKNISDVCDAIKKLADNNIANFFVTLHPNPAVRNPIISKLESMNNVILANPLDYREFCEAMKRSDIIMTDSGGIQEEAPSLKKPVLVLRQNTERTEAVLAGTVELVGTDTDHIVKRVTSILSSSMEMERFVCSDNPYGAGDASAKIENSLNMLLRQG